MVGVLPSKGLMPGLLYSVSLTPQQFTVNPCLRRRLPDTLGKSAQSLVGSLLLSPGSWCSQRFVCALQESVSPVLWKLCNQVPLAFKVKFPGVSQSLCQITRLANLFWALEIFQQCENFFGIIIFQFVVLCSVALWWDSHDMPPRSASARAPGPPGAPNPMQVSADSYLHSSVQSLSRA